MKNMVISERIISLFLWLVGIHSFVAGVLLIILPPDLLAFFGFEIVEKFFSTQGGVFHIVMCFAYIPAALRPRDSSQLIYFSIAAKLTATVFLVSYFFLKNPIWIVLISGLGDFLMGIILFYLYRNLRFSDHASQK